MVQPTKDGSDMRYVAVYEKTASGGWSVHVRGVSGVQALEGTIEQARDAIRRNLSAAVGQKISAAEIADEFGPVDAWAGLGALAFIAGAALFLATPMPMVGRTALGDVRWVPLIAIYLVSVPSGQLVVASMMRTIRRLCDVDEDRTPVDEWPPRFMGLCESVLFPAVLMMGKMEAIGLWLGVKVAGNWAGWTGDVGIPIGTRETLKEAHGESERRRARRRFYVFLIGNALSIMASFVTYAALKLFAIVPLQGPLP